MNKDVIIVAGGSNGMLDLFVRPELKSYDAIRGKSVVVDAPDTAYAFVLYKMLALKGLKRGDYGIAAGGDCTRRFNGIRNDPNNVAVLLNLPCSIVAARRLSARGSASDALGAYQADGVWVMRSGHINTPIRPSNISKPSSRPSWASRPRIGPTVTLSASSSVAPDIAERSVELAIGPRGGLDKDARLNIMGFENLLSLRAEMTGGSVARREVSRSYIV